LGKIDKMAKHTFLILFTSILFSCNTQTNAPNEAPNTRIYQEAATLWFQQAGEVRALQYQAFQLASLRLKEYLANPTSDKKACVVVDIDETVLDNSPHQAWTILNNQVFPAGWKEWTDLAKAEAIPGAVEFLQFAAENGVEVFYVTNRYENERESTLRNLTEKGFPFADSLHLRLKTDTGSKVARRNAILQEYEVVLYCGDNLSDFDNFNELSLTERNAKTDSMRAYFGTKFIVLPNPMYGDWEGAVYNYDYKQPDSTKQQLRKQALQSF
jgi:5'-nucleotidase (lipoprotein e(P4) family)